MSQHRATGELKEMAGEFGDLYFEDLAKVVFTQNNRCGMPSLTDLKCHH